MAGSKVYTNEKKGITYIRTAKEDIYTFEGYNKTIITSYKKGEMSHKILDDSLEEINPACAKRITMHTLVALKIEEMEKETENNLTEENAKELAKMICAYVFC